MIIITPAVPLVKIDYGPASNDREVVRCGNRNCQAHNRPRFLTKNGRCPACGMGLQSERPSLPPIAPPAPPAETEGAANASGAGVNEALVKNVGERIRLLREAKGLTQSQLQELSGVSRSYICRIESGKMTPSLGTLEKIGAALGHGLNFFFRKDEGLLFADPFIREVARGIKKLGAKEREFLLQRLKAIS